jgi:hypothetical protein
LGWCFTQGGALTLALGWYVVALQGAGRANKARQPTPGEGVEISIARRRGFMELADEIERYKVRG